MPADFAREIGKRIVPRGFRDARAQIPDVAWLAQVVFQRRHLRSIVTTSEPCVQWVIRSNGSAWRLGMWEDLRTPVVWGEPLFLFVRSACFSQIVHGHNSSVTVQSRGWSWDGAG